MKCPIDTHENTELLLAYCARRLDPETQIVLERHMAVCPACRKFQAGQETVWQALDAWEAMPVSADFDRRLYRRIEGESARTSWWLRLARPLNHLFGAPLLRRSAPVAAICLLVLGAVILQHPNALVALSQRSG